jgi:KDO2-lipid IV(A) lauroyltransferase
VGAEHLDPERGGLLVGAHLGNWEWMATVIRGLGFETAEVVRPLDDPVLNAYVERVRRSRGVYTIDKEGAGAEIMRLLREKWVVGVLADQSPRMSAVPVTFFGQPCWATIAPAMVACRMHLPIYVVTMTRGPAGRYTVKISSPVLLDAPGDLRERLVAITQRCQDILEAEIRKCPEQWLWLHRRWKRRPRLEAEWRERTLRQGMRTESATDDETPDGG